MDVSRLGNPSHPKHDLRLLPWESQTSPSPSRIWWREHISCSANASCWGSPHLHERDSIMNPYGEGWHLDRARFDQFMRDWWGKSTMSGVRELWEKTTFQSAEKDADGRWIVTVRRTESDGDHEVVTVGCDWLIDASGRRACMARKEGQDPAKHDQLLAFYAVFESSPNHPNNPDRDNRTIVESCRDGWWYTSLLPGNRRVVASTRTPTIRSPSSRAGTMNFYRYCTSTPSKSERSSSSMGMSSPTAKGSRGARLHTGPGCRNSSTRGGTLQSGAVLGRTLSAGMEEYGNFMENVWERYIEGAHYYYGKERRWPESAFWMARH
ncbi:hypothetical protein BC938DRAFT_483394 [Jimgerdemannia flammicorona]|uniref:FAD-binding domain-containing protein n=1 Tax=Jimgerdemannia flammicorona TaxID=994334 RepID=A0A433R086_9FUNG|nr:hypothetical protein BC938DRAFT_483394 [Jimgerdemannia flammicorona]